MFIAVEQFEQIEKSKDEKTHPPNWVRNKRKLMLDFMIFCTIRRNFTNLWLPVRETRKSGKMTHTERVAVFPNLDSSWTSWVRWKAKEPNNPFPQPFSFSENCCHNNEIYVAIAMAALSTKNEVLGVDKVKEADSATLYLSSALKESRITQALWKRQPFS